VKRAHRRTHLFLWLVIGPLALVGLVAGVAARSSKPSQDPGTAVDTINAVLPPAEPPTEEVNEE